jgi:hypothetical protein
MDGQAIYEQRTGTPETGAGLRTAEQRMKDARAVLKKHGITETQADALRTASRKYSNSLKNKGDLHDGTVSEYGVMSKTLLALSELKLITFEYKVAEEKERRRLECRAEGIIITAFDIARMCQSCSLTPQYFSDENPSTPPWMLVRADLNTAHGIYAALDVKVWRITEAGRKVAAEWKAALGAVEE